ncbi:OPT oligopeptide transporter [Mycena kentingensis (nom. inval.)]|nr:OPT oligopeptide transporter [Mycena kentingensis (nom. inval.)]
MDSYKLYSSSTTALPQQPQLVDRRRNSYPDVPEDIDANFYEEHLNDPNFDLTDPHGRRLSTEQVIEVPGDIELSFATPMTATDATLASSTSHFRPQSTITSTELDDESPYAEVRMAVSKVDDPLMPVNTFRMWFLGLTFTVLLSGMNQIFEYRAPSVFISGIVGQLVSLAAGKFLEWSLPTTTFRSFGYNWSFNPGPFNIKEHVCITAMVNIAYNGAIATDVLATQQKLFGQNITVIYQLLLILGTQSFGFSLGGMLRRFVVYPSSMIWPSALVSSALFNTLHTTYGKRERGHMTRQRFFFIACASCLIWSWVPGYLFTGLSFFTWVCWAAKDDLVVNNFFGALSGMGMSSLSLDWAQISLIGSPLATPWWSSANVISSLVLCFWLVTPAIYYSNAFFTAFLPLSSFLVFDNNGAPYNISATVVDGVFNATAYVEYSPVFLTSSMITGYFVAFAFFSSLFSHTFLWFGREIVRRINSPPERDVHSRLMSAYPEAPQWWFVAVGAISMACIFIAIDLMPINGLPVWAALVALLLAMALALPMCLLQAKTNQLLALNVMEELLAGFIVPGRPVGNMIFKTICVAGTQQAITYASDLKLGMYMKIPPRTMFAIQIAAVVVTCFVTTGASSWMLANVPGICTADAPGGFVCPGTNVFADAALIWGGIGPGRLFGAESIYRHLLWAFPVGFFAPFPFYFLARRYPLSIFRFVNMPIFFGGVAAIPAASPYNFACWSVFAVIFGLYIRRTHFRWWMRYTYILSAALDAGLALASIAIFFSVILPMGGFELKWIGNTIWQNTADGLGLPLLVANATFGPSVW